MNELSNSLTTRNPKAKLLVVRGSPQTMLPLLFKEWGITHLVYEKDTSGYAARRDHQINTLASQAEIKVLAVLGHTLYDPEAVVKANGGKPTMSLTSWRAVGVVYLRFTLTTVFSTALSISQATKKLPPPSRPLPAPETIPSPGRTELSTNFIAACPTPHPLTDLNAQVRIGGVTCYGRYSLAAYAFPWIITLPLQIQFRVLTVILGSQPSMNLAYKTQLHPFMAENLKPCAV